MPPPPYPTVGFAAIADGIRGEHMCDGVFLFSQPLAYRQFFCTKTKLHEQFNEQGSQHGEIEGLMNSKATESNAHQKEPSVLQGCVCQNFKAHKLMRS